MNCIWFWNARVTQLCDSAITCVCWCWWLASCQWCAGSTPLEGPSSSQQLRGFMQDQAQVASFLYDCAPGRWQNPPDELVFAECLEVQEGDGGSPPNVLPDSEEFAGACSGEFMLHPEVYDLFPEDPIMTLVLMPHEPYVAPTFIHSLLHLLLLRGVPEPCK